MRRQRFTRIFVLSAIGATLIASLPAAPATGGEVRRYGRIAPGIVHKVIRQRKVPRVIHVVIADVAGPGALRVALSNGALSGLERTSSMARRNGAIAAINGDFFRPSGRPVAAFARAGDLVQTPITWGANLAFGRGGRSAFMGHPSVHVRLISARSGEKLRIVRVNTGRPRRRTLRLYTKDAGKIVRPPRNACSARLKRSGTKRFSADGAEVITPVEVGAVRCRRARMKFGGGMVVAGRRFGPARAAIRDLRSDRRQRLVWSLGWPNVGETIGGNPVMVKEGQLASNNLRGSHSIFRRHPRTGVALRKDGKIMFVTVDGRRPRYSKGITLLGFARLMKSLGASWALNLDGGGSTTMVVKGRVMNRPSDGRERPVGSALMLVGSAGRATSSFPTMPAPEPEPTDGTVDPQVAYGDGAAANLAMTDPASIGGLASWLQAEGESLPSGLAGVARRFDRIEARADYFGSPTSYTETSP